VKILLISYNLRRRGGIERLSLDVVEALQAQGHQLLLLSTRRLGPGLIGRLLGQLWFSCQLAIASRRCEQLFCMHALLLAQVEWLLPRNMPRLCWLHGVEVWGKALAPLAIALCRCRLLVASSNFTRSKLLEHSHPWPPVLVANPPARLWFGQVLPEPLPAQAQGLRMLTVARMAADERYKGHDLIIEALCLLNTDNWQWQIVGIGDDQPRLRALVNKFGLAERVCFSGPLNDDQLRQAYQDCNLLVMPSSYGLRTDGSATGEGFGITYLEAAMAGRASLACIEGGQSDLITAGNTGWLVQPNVEDLLTNLQAILNNLGELARRGAAAKENADAMYTYHNFQNRLANVITED